MKNLFSFIVAGIAGILVLVSCSGNQTTDQTNIVSDSLANNESVAPINYLEIGKEMAIQTKSGLAKNLISAISERGSDGAVEFCNTRAIPITDSMSLVLDAKIKRVSDLPRNPNNQANEAELAYIKKWKVANVIGEEQAPIVNEIEGKMVGYYPITTNQMCMQCHGKPEIDINTKTLKKIKKLYPNDQAIGYTENEMRGIFVVEMNKK